MEIWIILGILAVIALGIFIANNAPTDFYQKYLKYNQIRGFNCQTVEEFLEKLQRDPLFSKVKITRTTEELKDAYSSSDNCVILSEKTLAGVDIASFATVAHEFGHAEQFLTEDKRYLFCHKLRKLSRICGVFAVPLLILGLICIFLLQSPIIGWICSIIGAISLLTILFSNFLITIVEFDASKRALKILERFSELDQKEIKKANRFLRSAGYTYLGNFCSTLFIWTFLVPNPKII